MKCESLATASCGCASSIRWSSVVPERGKLARTAVFLGLPGIDGRDLYMALQHTWPELTRRMVFICAEPTEAFRDFALRTRVPLLRVPADAEEFQKARSALPGPDPFI